MQSNMMLKINKVSKSFGNTYILNDFSFDFQEGVIYALMGINGSRKTTLLNIISGFLKPDSGSIMLDDKEIIGEKPHSIANLGVSRTFQNLRLIESLSVEENIYVAFKNKRGENILQAFMSRSEKKQYKERIEQLLELTNIQDIKNQKAGDISYGQQKLLNLAVALAGDSKLLLLDEPVAGVQPRYREEIVGILKKVQKIVIFIEHDQEFIEAMADNVLFLHNGAVFATGNYESIKNNPLIQEVYL